MIRSKTNQNMGKKKLTNLAVIGILTVIISGCSVAPKATYESVNELRLAFVNAGGSCADWIQDNAVVDAIESGTCGPQTVLMVFSTAEEAETRAEYLRQRMSAFGMDVALLLGDNWLVNSAESSLVEPTLGGRLIDE